MDTLPSKTSVSQATTQQRRAYGNCNQQGDHDGVLWRQPETQGSTNLCPSTLMQCRSSGHAQTPATALRHQASSDPPTRCRSDPRFRPCLHFAGATNFAPASAPKTLDESRLAAPRHRNCEFLPGMCSCAACVLLLQLLLLLHERRAWRTCWCRRL